MSLPVHFLADLVGVGVGDTVEVGGEEAHHAVAVRRLRIGEPVALTDGVGTWLEGEVVDTDKRVFQVRATGVVRNTAPQPEFTVVQALPKGDRGELAVEVLTEIGVSRVVPWAASRSVAVWKGERGTKSLARWRSTAFQAAKQARRSWFPEVSDLADSAEVCRLIAGCDVAVILHEEASGSLADVEMADVELAGSVLLVVGPEGGLSQDEVEAFVAAGARSVRLGAEVLRTSTAGLAAVAALLARTPRWG